MDAPEPEAADREVLAAESLWIRRAARGEGAVRLICLPYGGGGASAFAPLARHLPASLEAVAVQLPGREDRFWENAATRMAPLVRACAVALRPFCAYPFAIYGHCAGALLGYELACELGERYGLWPRHLVVGAQAAPHLPGPESRLGDLDDDAAVDVLREWGGLPAAVEQEPNLLRLLMPMLRADFGLWQDYTPRRRVALPCPVTSLRGAADSLVSADLAAGWQYYTAHAYADRPVAGGHFFISDHPAAIAVALADVLRGS